MDLELINKIMKIEDIESNIYVNKNITSKQIDEIKINDYTEVENVNECIRDININSASYSNSIF